MNGWYAVDMDGTLAEYNGWQGAGHVGAPIERTVRRVKKWLKDGKEVRVFTAMVYVGPLPTTTDFTQGSNTEWAEWDKRAAEAAQAEDAIKKWCLEHIGQVLSVTCQKDYSMVLLLDDRALQCYPNTGELVQERLSKAEKKLAGLGLEYKDGQYDYKETGQEFREGWPTYALNTQESDMCKRCGRDLDKLGQYRDYVHYRLDNSEVPCLEPAKQ